MAHAVISDLTNPNEKVLNLPAGTVSASVTATGTTTPALLGPADVPVVEGTNTIVYAWGSATADAGHPRTRHADDRRVCTATRRA